MPRFGAEPERKRDLINAALNAIGESGSLDITVKQIADKAGMSPALAFHYFGGKEQIVTETMRHLLGELAATMVKNLRGKSDPVERLGAIIEASFSAGQFKRKTIAAWLVFYVHAYSSKQASRLLNIYTRRLQSNLVHAYTLAIGNKSEAKLAAEALASLIDGVFIRQALRKSGPNRKEAITLCMAHLTASLKQDN